MRKSELVDLTNCHLLLAGTLYVNDMIVYITSASGQGTSAIMRRSEMKVFWSLHSTRLRSTYTRGLILLPALFRKTTVGICAMRQSAHNPLSSASVHQHALREM